MQIFGSTLMGAAILIILVGGALAALSTDLAWVVCVGGAGLGGVGHRLRSGSWD